MTLREICIYKYHVTYICTVSSLLHVYVDASNLYENFGRIALEYTLEIVKDFSDKTKVFQLKITKFHKVEKLITEGTKDQR